MRLRLFTILLILTASCKTKTSEWQTLDFGSFKLKTPSGWTEIERTGIDSYVGGLTNGKDTLSFDYGWYSPDIGDEDPKKHKFGQDTINGLIARIAIPITPGDGYIRMYIPVNRDDKFSISGHNIQSTDTILKIFKSIVFKESDTTINSELTMSKFKEYPNGTGKTLVMQKCASCHAMNKIVEGPALKDLMQDRTSEWLYKFFTNRGSVSNDSMHIKLKEVFNNRECMTFPDITKEEIELIRENIMNR
ncbi:MAG TPA: c-type cytochrome [Chitinophagaceae bacterium]|nr:c-type cytochrome [Chitinophagaceae bacterium]